MESGALTLVPASSRRRRHEDGERRRRRSRSRRRASPPSDWRGPVGGPEWRPPEWQYPPPGHWPPQRPMYPRPMPGYSPWHVPPPREPMDWRNPAPGSWTPPTAPPNHWGGNTGGPPAHWGGPAGPAPGPGAPLVAGAAKGPFEPTPVEKPIENGAPEEPVLEVPTASERLRKVRLVPSALSEAMKEKLHTLGVLPKGKAMDQGPEPEKPLDAGASGLCSFLGLSALQLPKSKLPVSARRFCKLPVCTLGLAQAGLWERFRQRCGTWLGPGFRRSAS
ncbi:unnamed protein product [Effrenium voratum]|nr:unnamed protein product [Effrenium voratum]